MKAKGEKTIDNCKKKNKEMKTESTKVIQLIYFSSVHVSFAMAKGRNGINLILARVNKLIDR